MIADANPVYASLGVGVNSVAELVEMIRRGERVDAIGFADPGAEFPHTYRYFEMFSEWLVDRGYPRPVVTRASRTIIQDCLTRETLPSIAFGYKTCSQRFKVEPQAKLLNNWLLAQEAWARGDRVIKCIAYDAGESHRAKPYSDEKFIVRYPLVEWGMDRDDCVSAIERAGLPIPGKSSCTICPSMKAAEVVAMARNYPERAAEALHLEGVAIPNLVNIKGLGRRFSWASILAADEAQIKMFPEGVPECQECHL